MYGDVAADTRTVTLKIKQYACTYLFFTPMKDFMQIHYRVTGKACGLQSEKIQRDAGIRVEISPNCLWLCTGPVSQC